MRELVVPPRRRFAPFTTAYLLVLVATTIVLARLPDRDADHLLLSRSTNLHQLAHDPLRVLVASAFWLSGAWQLPLAALLFVVVLAPVERRLGAARTGAAFALGHLGASLLVAGGLWLALRVDAVDPSVVDARDVGVSYGVAAVAGLLTYLLDRHLRRPYALTIGGFLVLVVAVSPEFTSFGHLLAFLLGLACYPLASRAPERAHGALTTGAQAARVSRRKMKTAARISWLLLALAALAAAALGAGFAFANRSGTPATKAPATPREAGVVVVQTNLAYQDAAAAGTGIVLTRAGVVLTNNHVIRGATTIRVLVPGTGRRYTARVLGYSVAADVAVLKLSATGLRTATLGDSTKLRVGQAVTALGNAGGSGSLTAASGRITGLGRSITASDDQGSYERLTGLIQTDADVQPGDSGGPLLDASNRVIGVDTAASRGFSFTSSGNRAFAIPIARALSIVEQIKRGRGSSTVHVGATAFLGVQVRSSDPYADDAGAVVTGVVPGSPAENAGLAPGDVITGLDGRTIDSPQALTSLLLLDHPGSTVRLTWGDGFGGEKTASVTLASGPPQ